MQDVSIGDSYIFSASPGQERLWFIQQFDKQLGTAYHIPTAFKIKGNINRTALQKSLNNLVNRHETLRTALIDKDSTLKQVVKPNYIKIINFINYIHTPFAERENLILQQIHKEIEKPFNLSEPGLFRVSLYQIDKDLFYLSIVIHHCIADGISLEIFIRELFLGYESHLRDNEIKLPDLEYQFADIVEWNKEWYESEAYKQSAQYWKKKLENASFSINIPTNKFPQRAISDYEGIATKIDFGNQISSSIEELAKILKVSDYAVLLACFALLIYLYSGQRDFIIGVPVANRFRKEMEPIIGFFANTIIIRFIFHDDITISELINQAHQNITEAVLHQRFPYKHLHDIINPERKIHENSLFQLMFGFQELPKELCNLPLIEVERVPVASNISRFYLSLFMLKEDGCYKGILEYSSTLFSDSTIKIFLKRFYSIFNTIINNINFKIDDVEYFQITDGDIDGLILKSLNFKSNIDKHLEDLLKYKNIQLNTKSVIRILNKRFKQVPIDFAGELEIDGVMTGILAKLNPHGIIEALDERNINKNLENDLAADQEKARTSTELNLEACWKELLKIDCYIPINKSFFALGGHSLLVAKMIDMIEKRLGVSVSIKDIFFTPTIWHIAQKIDLLKNNNNVNEQNILDLKQEEYLSLLKDFIA